MKASAPHRYCPPRPGPDPLSPSPPRPTQRQNQETSLVERQVEFVLVDQAGSPGLLKRTLQFEGRELGRCCRTRPVLTAPPNSHSDHERNAGPLQVVSSLGGMSRTPA